MGRNAPKSMKHKKMKAIDPFYKGNRKAFLNRDNEKCNAKPSNPDVQEVPRRLKEIMQSKLLLKEGKLGKKRKAPSALGDDYGKNVKGCERRIREGPVFEKRLGETDAELLRRVETYTRNVLAETKLESKYDVIITEDKHGNVDVEKTKTDIDIEKGMAAKKKKTSDAKKLKRKKLDAKRREKKHFKRAKVIGDFDHLKDQVKFGEVAAQPPTIKCVPRKSDPLSASRKPAAKQLLLKSMMGSKDMQNIRRELHLVGSPRSKVDRTVKRKLLSVSDRRKLDTERENAVNAYRAIKKNRLPNKN